MNETAVEEEVEKIASGGETPETPSPKNFRKMLFIGGGALLVLLLAGGGYFMFASGGNSLDEVAGESESNEDDPLLAQAMDWVKKGNMEEAMNIVRPLTKVKPPNIEYLYTGAWLNYKLNRRKEAFKLAKAALALDETRADIQALVGACYFLYAETKKALEYSYKAIELNPDLALPYMTIGEVYLRENNSKRALPILKKAGRLEPENPEVWVRLSSAFLKMEDLPNALLAGKAAINLNPDSPSGHFNLAMVYLKMKDSLGAVKHSQRAEELYQLRGDPHWTAQARKNKDFILRFFKLRPEDILGKPASEPTEQ
jgi:tetratricopeptide (TPR) repeat protein